MANIVMVHHPDLESHIMAEAMKAFYWIRSLPGLLKKPSTSELLDWVQALVVGGIHPEKIVSEIPFLGVILKKNQDFDQVLKRIHSAGGVQRQTGWTAGKKYL
ncbi:MAG: MoxR family ATPase, partial [Firmicutes bacterium]|nr:MoxR family ATPase [Bacillota bacterium]